MTRRTGARVVADMLDGYGVTHVFLVPAILRRTLAELELIAEAARRRARAFRERRISWRNAPRQSLFCGKRRRL